MVDSYPQDYMKQKFQAPEDLEFDPENMDKFKDENMYKYHDNC